MMIPKSIMTKDKEVSDMSHIDLLILLYEFKYYTGQCIATEHVSDIIMNNIS